MEVVLQWLDELDDLVFTGFRIWQDIRRICLTIAAAAAIGLHVIPALGVAVDAVLGLRDLALAALITWMVFAVLSSRAERSSRARTLRA